MKNYNETHPELQKGEAFYENVSKSNTERLSENRSQFKTFRVGIDARLINGQPYSSAFPTFVSVAELEKKGVPTDFMCRCIFLASQRV